MGILGISNRTENWKTAKTFVPLLDNKQALNELVWYLNDSDNSTQEDLELELFWKPIRDRRFQCKESDKKKTFESELVDRYEREFEGLRSEIEAFDGFKSLDDDVNYKEKIEDCAVKKKLIDNLINTEIDIVIQSKNCLYIGEAKSVCSFGSASKNVLVHQLVRQFVVATLIAECVEGQKLCIKPFVILNKQPEEERRPDQLRFLIAQGCMPRENILTWDCLPNIFNGA